MSRTLHYGSDHVWPSRQAIDGWSRLDLFAGLVRQMPHKLQARIGRSRQCQLVPVLPKVVDKSLDDKERQAASVFWQTYARRHLK